ncbi:MAG: type II secretion system GspH family protein [Oligoflexia bacterium]|nr:type II secretion system GspH family protein [Oligoflexia bacterium]
MQIQISSSPGRNTLYASPAQAKREQNSVKSPRSGGVRRRPCKSASAFLRLRQGSAPAFTLIELILVIAIIGVASTLVLIRTGSVSYWQEQAYLRRLTDNIEFLHHQAEQDAEHYALEVNFKQNSYRIGVYKSEAENMNAFYEVDQQAGALSYELAAVLNPALSDSYTMIPPPSFPSLFEPAIAPAGMWFQDLRNQRGLSTPAQDETATIVFSPRGYSEFAVIHLRVSNDAPRTILVNPFTGLTEVYNDDRDFKWSYGGKNKQ